MSLELKTLLASTGSELFAKIGEHFFELNVTFDDLKEHNLIADLFDENDWKKIKTDNNFKKNIVINNILQLINEKKINQECILIKQTFYGLNSKIYAGIGDCLFNFQITLNDIKNMDDMHTLICNDELEKLEILSEGKKNFVFRKTLSMINEIKSTYNVENINNGNALNNNIVNENKENCNSDKRYDNTNDKPVVSQKKRKIGLIDDNSHDRKKAVTPNQNVTISIQNKSKINGTNNNTTFTISNPNIVNNRQLVIENSAQQPKELISNFIASNQNYLFLTAIAVYKYFKRCTQYDTRTKFAELNVCINEYVQLSNNNNDYANAILEFLGTNNLFTFQFLNELKKADIKFEIVKQINLNAGLTFASNNNQFLFQKLTNIFIRNKQKMSSEDLIFTLLLHYVYDNINGMEDDAIVEVIDKVAFYSIDGRHFYELEHNEILEILCCNTTLNQYENAKKKVAYLPIVSKLCQYFDKH